MPDNKLFNQLQYILNHVNDMLKFAEAKNAGLIAFNIAVIFGIAQLNFGSNNIYLCLGCYVIIMSILSIFFSLIAIYAQLKVVEAKPKLEFSDNLLFFGSIALLTPSIFLTELKKRYNLNSHNELLEYDMARQIIIISQIAVRKYRYFNIAMNFTFASLPPAIIMYFLFERVFNPNK